MPKIFHSEVKFRSTNYTTNFTNFFFSVKYDFFWFNILLFWKTLNLDLNVDMPVSVGAICAGTSSPDVLRTQTHVDHAQLSERLAEFYFAESIL